MTMPPSPLTARSPRAPSLPAPESTMHTARSCWSAVSSMSCPPGPGCWGSRQRRSSLDTGGESIVVRYVVTRSRRVGAWMTTSKRKPTATRKAAAPPAAKDAAVPAGEPLGMAFVPEQLLGYVSRTVGRAPQTARAAAPGAADLLLPQVLHLLRDRSGHDFTHYKTDTLRRRVERRIAVTRVEGMDSYLTLLKRDSLEVETLFRELLIGVTNFFRDAPAFEALVAEALPRLIAAHAPGDPVRVWVPGCSTGEEAYSIAMLLQEHGDRVGLLARGAARRPHAHRFPRCCRLELAGR